MRRVLILVIVLYSILGYGCNTQKVKSDKEYKDSIAQADKNTALGNIKFGISEEEFNKQAEIFYKQQDGYIYNVKIKSITGLFTEKSNKLCAVVFTSGYWFDSPSDSLPESPFKEFLLKKFGKTTENRTYWDIGDRHISSYFEYRPRPFDAYYYDEDEIGEIEKSTNGLEVTYHNYYELVISNSPLFEQYLKENGTYKESRIYQVKRAEEQIKKL